MVATTKTAKKASNADLHATSRVRKVDLEGIRADSSYQRVPSQALVEKIADEWDVVASELVLVSDRGPRPESSDVSGGLWIVNGQHRLLAARRKGLKTIDARVIDLSKEPDPGKIESALRLKTNVRRGDVSTERFKAQLRSGDEDTIAIIAILARYDTEVNMQGGNTESGVNAVSALEQIYRIDPGLLDETLSLIRDAYKVVNPKTAQAYMMKAFAWFVLQHGMEVNRDRIVDILRGIGPAALVQRGRTMQSTMSGSGWLNIYRVMVESYNDRLTVKNRLVPKTRGGRSFGQQSGEQDIHH